MGAATCLFGCALILRAETKTAALWAAVVKRTVEGHRLPSRPFVTRAGASHPGDLAGLRRETRPGGGPCNQPSCMRCGRFRMAPGGARTLSIY